MRSPWVGVYLDPIGSSKTCTHTIFNLFPKASSHLIGVADIAHKVFSLCTVLQDCWFPLSEHLFWNSENDSGVICKLQNRAFSMSGVAVMGVRCVQEGDEHTTLGALVFSTGVEEMWPCLNYLQMSETNRWQEGNRELLICWKGKESNSKTFIALISFHCTVLSVWSSVSAMVWTFLTAPRNKHNPWPEFSVFCLTLKFLWVYWYIDLDVNYVIFAACSYWDAGLTIFNWCHLVKIEM